MMYPTPKTPPSSNYKSSPSLPPPHNQQPNRRLTSTTPQLHPPFYLSHDQPTTMITAGSSEPTSTTLNFQPYYHHQIQNSHYHNQNDVDEDEEETITTTEVVLEEDEEKEYMFEKPLTPSDVGKLNRLVIPKQYAEKYFPLSGDSGDKGLLLSFEDESGKFWRFRYSYWNSSQSYVLTKGWSRFVKDKRLDAGDVVSFERRRFDVQRLFIRWRRRSAVGVVEDSSSRVVSQNVVASNSSSSSRGGGWSREFYYAHPYPSHYTTHGPLPYPPDCLHAAQQQYAGYTVEPVVEKPKKKSGNSKRLRLFGVNLECQLDD